MTLFKLMAENVSYRRLMVGYRGGDLAQCFIQRRGGRSLADAAWYERLQVTFWYWAGPKLSGSKVGTGFLWVEEVYDQVVGGILSMVCRVRGHRLYDDSTAGPDSGNMDHGCSRCGAHWHVPLY